MPEHEYPDDFARNALSYAPDDEALAMPVEVLASVEAREADVS